MAGPIQERNQDATVYVGNLDEKVTEPLLWELFLQSGPVVNVHMPKDRITQAHQGYGFVEFMGEDDADYAIKIMNMIKVYGKPIRVNKASAHNKNLDVGANVFIGNLDPEIDEKLLYDTFSAFGVILQTPKIMRDPETGNSKGFAFINFASFAASDAAIEAMNGQYLSNRPISVSYAFKKDSKGERHGSAAERLLAAQNPLTQTDRPHQLFADAPPVMQNMPMQSDLSQMMPGMPMSMPLMHQPNAGPGLSMQNMHMQGMPPHGMLPPGMMPLPGMPQMPQSSQFAPFSSSSSVPVSSSGFPSAPHQAPQHGFMSSQDGQSSHGMMPIGQRPPILPPPRNMLPPGHLPPPVPPPGMMQGQRQQQQQQPSQMDNSSSGPRPLFGGPGGFPLMPPGRGPPDMTGNFGPPGQFGPPPPGQFGQLPMGQPPPFGGMYRAPQNEEFGQHANQRMRPPMDQRGGIRPRMMQPPRPPPRS